MPWNLAVIVVQNDLRLAVRPGQSVIASGDRGLPAAPAWGVGGFTVQQFGSLALSYVRLDAQVRLRFLAAPPLSRFFCISPGRRTACQERRSHAEQDRVFILCLMVLYDCVFRARPPISPADLGARGDRRRRALASAARPAASGHGHGARRPLRRRQPPRAAGGREVPTAFTQLKPECRRAWAPACLSAEAAPRITLYTHTSSRRALALAGTIH